MDVDFCVNASKSPLRKLKPPEIFNTDQGAQYTWEVFTGSLKDYGVQTSMDGKVRCMNNIFIERLWRSKHGSWLNMAEIEFRIFGRECLGRRIPDKTALIN